MRCAVCNEQVLGDDGSGLCYLHRKYNHRLCGPYFETLYDLVYWKATFLKTWDSLGYGKINVACAEHVDIQKMNNKSVARVKERVRQQLERDRIDLSMYHPLVASMSRQFSQRSGIEFTELMNQGVMVLKRLEDKINSDTDPKMISSFVKQSIRGSLMTYTMQSQVVKPPHGQSLSMISTEDTDELLNEEDVDFQYMAKIKEQMGTEAIIQLTRVFKWHKSPVYLKVIKNMFVEYPKTQVELARQLDITSAAVSKATAKVLDTAKGLGYARNGSGRGA